MGWSTKGRAGRLLKGCTHDEFPAGPEHQLPSPAARRELSRSLAERISDFYDLQKWTTEPPVLARMSRCAKGYPDLLMCLGDESRPVEDHQRWIGAAEGCLGQLLRF